MCFYISSKGRQRCIPLSYMDMVYKCRYSNSEARIPFKVNSNIWNTSCPTQMSQHNVYSHLDMYTSDVSRFKYRVNQRRMYRTNKHINTYRVYGSIISTNIHKPGRCTFFWLQQHPFFSQHLGPFRCVPLMVHLYYYC